MYGEAAIYIPAVSPKEYGKASAQAAKKALAAVEAEARVARRDIALEHKLSKDARRAPGADGTFTFCGADRRIVTAIGGHHPGKHSGRGGSRCPRTHLARARGWRRGESNP